MRHFPRGTNGGALVHGSELQGKFGKKTGRDDTMSSVLGFGRDGRAGTAGVSDYRIYRATPGDG